VNSSDHPITSSPHHLITLRDAARRVWRVGWETVRKYEEDGGPLIAAALSFFTLLSVIPLVLLGVWGLGHFLSSAEAFRYVVEYMEEYLPGAGREVRERLREYLRQLVESRGTIGWLGLAGLIWSGSQVFVVLEAAINRALRVPQRRNLLESRLMGFGMILLAGGSLALSLVITYMITTIRSYKLPFVGWSPGEIPLLWAVVGAVVPILLTVLSFTVIYGVVPNTLVPWRTTLIAGATAGLLWEMAKRLFTALVSRVSYDQVYGPIGGVIGLVFWIYYSSVILVLGAELASVLENVHPWTGSRPQTADDR
jgi:membrane protein